MDIVTMRQGIMQPFALPLILARPNGFRGSEQNVRKIKFG
jgi:hypothetical protein